MPEPLGNPLSPRPFAALVALVVPPRCPACGSACAPAKPLCAGCERALARSRPVLGVPPGTGLDLAWSATSYEGVPRQVVAALKFGAALPLGARMAAAIAAAAPPGEPAGALVPVPAAPWRLRRRGFDPAAEIAAQLAELTGLALCPCLSRRNGPRQVGRPRAQRLARPPRVRCAGPAPPRAVLVDDVLTTGATLAACAAALRHGGSEEVVAATFSKTR